MTLAFIAFMILFLPKVSRALVVAFAKFLFVAVIPWVLTLGFVTYDFFLVKPSNRTRILRVTLPGWSRFTQLHQINEREIRFQA